MTTILIFNAISSTVAGAALVAVSIRASRVGRPRAALVRRGSDG